jgi:hypothetical protein
VSPRPIVAAALAVAALLASSAPAGAQLYRRPADPQELEGPRRAPITITPFLVVEEEFDDNVFLNNDDQDWDFITRFSPGISLELERAQYRLAAAYSFSADLYARHPELNRAFDRHNFVLDSVYRVDEHLAFSLTDTFALTTNTNLISVEGVATGRDRSWGNGLAAGVTWELNPLTALRGTASWAIQRFSSGDLRDSDVYRAEVALERKLSTRLIGSLGYEFGYFDIENEVNVMAHTPRLGVIYRFTETLTGTLNGGPIFEIPDSGESHITPAVRASLVQRTSWGSAGIDYNRYLGTAGGLGGTTINQLMGASLQFTSLAKGLIVDAAGRYSIVESHDDRIDIRSFTLPLTLTYRLANWISLVGSYNFFWQRSDSQVFASDGTPLANDVDQNRVSIGVMFGYPIRID